MFSLLLVASLCAAQPGADALGFATSADGLAFTRSAGPAVLARASGPDIVELNGSGKAGAAGTLVVYAVNRVRLTGTATRELIRVDSPDGGKTWSGGDPVEISGRPGGEPIGSVAAVQLPDGRLRLYFTHAGPGPRPRDPILPDPRDTQPQHPVKPPVPMTPDQPTWPRSPATPPARPDPLLPGMSVPERPVFSAISDDGTHFTLEPEARLSAAGLGAPDVVYLPAAGQWLMFYTAGSELHLARSRDGLAWERDGVFSAPGDAPPAACVALDGRVRVLRPLGANLDSVVLNPSTGTADTEHGAKLDSPAAEASACPRAAGGYAMVFTLPRSGWPGR